MGRDGGGGGCGSGGGGGGGACHLKPESALIGREDEDEAEDVALLFLVLLLDP